MILNPCTPKQGRIALTLILFIALFGSLNYEAQAKGKHPAREKRPAAKSARAERARDKSPKESRREARASNKREKLSPREQRAAKQEARDTDRKGGRGLSRRERALQARREAEQRRREIEEARRRAEIARQAAIARQRAIEQGLRDETQANIARDETTGEDMEVRRAAVSALGNHAGTVVVMDPQSGRVYSIVNQEWGVRRGYKPCSTIKLITGVAGLCDKVIDPTQPINVSAGSYSLDLTDSLAYSNNGYFQAVGGRVGFEHIISYAREMGLGEKTGINHANEYAGRVPMFKSGYAVNHMCSHGDDFEITPIQLASLVSAIGNGGELLTPHLPRTPQEDVQFKKEVRRHINVPPEMLQRMIPGMIGAVNYGTAKLAYDPRQTIAGKTGTCIGQGGWLGLFTSYAPVTNPKLSVVVVLRGSDARGKVAAAVAGKVYRALSNRFGTPLNMPVATTPDSLMPHPRINPKNAAIVSDEEEGDSEAAADAGVDANVNGAQTNSTRPMVKSVIMPVPMRQPVTPPSAPVKQPETKSTTPNQQSASPTSMVIPAPTSAGDLRPRRVFSNRP
jgi:penicillin-binding protein 2